jgi:hypothetical protein
MLPQPVLDALTTLRGALDDRPELADLLGRRFHGDARARGAELDGDLRAAADVLGAELPALTRTDAGLASLAALFDTPIGDPLFTWCSASTRRRDLRLAPLLAAAARAGYHDRAQIAAAIASSRGRCSTRSCARRCSAAGRARAAR